MEQTLSDLTVVVVGAGFGGLASAVELRRRGAKVTVLEAYSDFSRQGDVIAIGANATRIIRKWGIVFDDILNIAAMFDQAEILDNEGNLLLRQEMEKYYSEAPNIYTIRGSLHRIMYEFAQSIGVEFVFDTRGTEYFEDDNSASVSDGKKTFKADLILGADGVRSSAKKAVTGIADESRKSGVAIYRSWFPLQRLEADPLTKAIAKSKQSLFKVWIGKNTHGIIITNVNLQSIACYITHKDDADIGEGWNIAGDKEDMLRCVEGWDDTFRHIVQAIPPDCLIDYKLAWRDPVKAWVSKGGRIALLGDAAHPHLSTAATGGAQAIEDGVTIATLLGKTGKENIPLALRAYEKLRYERTSLTQRLGWETRHRWHQTDWEAVAANPDLLKLPQPVWLLGHDAERYADENFNAVRLHLEKGTPFRSKNIPEGHVHEDWTLEDMIALDGEKVYDGFYKAN